MKLTLLANQKVGQLLRAKSRYLKNHLKTILTYSVYVIIILLYPVYIIPKRHHFHFWNFITEIKIAIKMKLALFHLKI